MICLGLGIKKIAWLGLGQDHVLITTRCSKYIFFVVATNTTGNCPEFTLKISGTVTHL